MQGRVRRVSMDTRGTRLTCPLSAGAEPHLLGRFLLHIRPGFKQCVLHGRLDRGFTPERLSRSWSLCSGFSRLFSAGFPQFASATCRLPLVPEEVCEVLAFPGSRTEVVRKVMMQPQSSDIRPRLSHVMKLPVIQDVGSFL